MTHTENYLAETVQICHRIDYGKIEALVAELVALRERKGRLWIAGLGGSAANASHAANDFRKLCGIEAYSLTENIAEVTARANDEHWLRCLSLEFAVMEDALFILSVGGGKTGVSGPLIGVEVLAKTKNMQILGIVGRDGGYTAEHGDCVVIVPTVEASRVTPHTEGWQSVILHAIVSHPELQRNPTKW